jgi:hypothetical protein
LSLRWGWSGAQGWPSQFRRTTVQATLEPAYFSLNANDLEAICQNRATLYLTVEFDLKFLPVPVTAYSQHFHIAFAVKSVQEEQHQWNKAQSSGSMMQRVLDF